VYFEYPKPHDYKPVIRDVKLDVNPDKDSCQQYSEYKRNIFKLVPPGGYWRDIDPEIAKEYMKGSWYLGGGKTGMLRRISLDEPSLTVLTSPAMKQTDRCHPLEVRPFSYRENARIQTFPDDWEFCGKLTDKYKQIGNAVPVNLAKEIGLEIKKSLTGVNK
jgi:DNA (cytosine-5)-methyltransferase 1